ncbi:MAG: restriction endonuclease subunit S [Limnoraphis sp. WC205]|nr:restriction endonuclease subunit S [Limnoraphis sp. WC205]
MILAVYKEESGWWLSNHIPDCWEWSEFQYFYVNVTSSKKKLKQKLYLESGKYPVIDQGELLIGGYSNDEQLIYQGKLPVIIFGDHSRCVKFFENSFIQGADGVKVLIPTSIVFHKFAYWTLSAIKLPDKGYSRHFKFLQTSKFPLPPLNEQKRIVAKIEALQERSQRVKAELVAIRPLLNKFRQSVLAAAFRGDLTKDWREKNPDIEPASVLLERIKIEQEIWYEKGCQKAVDAGRRKPLNPKKNKKSDKQIFVIDNVPDTWKVIRLEDISYLVTDGTHKTPKYQEQGIPFLSVKNVRPFKVYDEDIKFVSQEEYEVINSRCNPEKGDILYTKVGATFGYAAINNLSYDFSIFVSLALIKPVNPYFSSEYAEAVMNSPIVYSQAKERVSGIGTPDLHLIEIRDFKIPLPPIEEQKEIVNRIDKLFKIADNIEHQYQKTETDLETLNQSILAKAFRGELVPQNPNDEPASVLLERIRKERETDSKPAKQTRQKPPKTDNNNSTQLTLEGIE